MNKVEDGRLVRPDMRPQKGQGLTTPGDPSTWSHHYQQVDLNLILWFRRNTLYRIAFMRPEDHTPEMDEEYVDEYFGEWTPAMEEVVAAKIFGAIREARNLVDYKEMSGALIQRAVRVWASDHRKLLDAQ